MKANPDGTSEQGAALITTDEGRMLLNDAAYTLVRDYASDELPLYVATRDNYFAHPTDFGQLQTGEHELDFGVGEMILTFTGVVFPLLAPILTYLVAEVAATLKTEVGKTLMDQVRALFKKPQPIFSVVQLRKIEREITLIADTEATRLNLSSAQVQAFKNALIKHLALAETA